MTSQAGKRFLKIHTESPFDIKGEKLQSLPTDLVVDEKIYCDNVEVKINIEKMVLFQMILFGMEPIKMKDLVMTLVSLRNTISVDEISIIISPEFFVYTFNHFIETI